MTLPRKIFLVIYWALAGWLAYQVWKLNLYRPVQKYLDTMFESWATLGYGIVGAGVFAVVFSGKDFIWSGFLYIVDMSLGISQHPANKREVMRKAISLNNHGKYSEAGSLYEEVEELKRASECYIKAAQWEHAARVLEYIGEQKRAAKMFEKAGAYEKAVEIYSKLNDEVAATQLHLRCAERAQTEGRLRNAADHFLEAKQLLRAAEILERMDNLEEAGNIFFKGGFFDRASECYKKLLDNYEEAIRGGSPPPGSISKMKSIRRRTAEALEKGGILDEAAQFFKAAEEWEKAGELFSQSNQHADATECYLKSGNSNAARESMRRSGNAEQLKEFAAIDSLESGNYNHAAQQFLSLGQLDKAMDAYRRGKNKKGMGEVYKMMGRYVSAAEQFALAGELEEAARMYEEGNDLQQASELYKDTGQHEKAISCMEREGNFLGAGLLLEKQNDIPKAIACLQRVRSDQEQYPEACSALARLFTREGLYDEAIRLFEVVIESGAAGQIQLHDFYVLAEKFEEAGRYAEAAESYRRIAGIDYSFRDATERHSRLKKEHPHIFGAPGSAPYPAQGAAVAPPHFTQNDTLQQTGASPQYSRTPFPPTSSGPEIASPSNQRLSAPPTGEFPMGSPPNQAFNDPGRPSAARGESGRSALSDASSMGQQRDRIADNETAGGLDNAWETGANFNAPQPSNEGAEGASTNPDRYELLEEIGRGGMGIVYKAKDTMLDRTVALKMLPGSTWTESTEGYQNFLHEARAIAKLAHQNIVTIFDIGRRADRFYFSMEYVNGRDLRRLVAERGAPEFPVAMRICRALGSALRYAHERGVVHRDIKPGNILISADEEIKIVDFGLAKIIGDQTKSEDGPGSISSGFMMGTPHYMSPEQIRGEDLDHRADIYSFGLTLYFMMTGKSVFDAFHCKSPMEVVEHQLNTDLPSPRKIDPSLPLELELVYFSCIEKDRDKRLATMKDALDQLEAVPV